jgi:hypothetical protein
MRVIKSDTHYQFELNYHAKGLENELITSDALLKRMIPPR